MQKIVKYGSIEVILLLQKLTDKRDANVKSSVKKPSRSMSRDYIYNEILNKIQYCEWTPDTPISETMLSDLFQVSRTPVREALFLLSQNGFVDIYPQSGSFVSKIDIKRIREIQYLRYYVETPILTELANQKTPLPEELEKLLLLEEFAAKKEQWADCVELDYSFHQELFALANHREIWNLIRPELPHYTRIRFFESDHTEFKGDPPRTLLEHKRILACIADGDIRGLHQALDSHYHHIVTLNHKYKSVNIQSDQYERILQHPEYFVNLDMLGGF